MKRDTEVRESVLTEGTKTYWQMADGVTVVMTEGRREVLSPETERRRTEYRAYRTLRVVTDADGLVTESGEWRSFQKSLDVPVIFPVEPETTYLRTYRVIAETGEWQLVKEVLGGKEQIIRDYKEFRKSRADGSRLETSELMTPFEESHGEIKIQVLAERSECVYRPNP